MVWRNVKQVMHMKKLKSNIGELLDQSPYKRKYLMQRYGKSANTISNWCRGKSFPSVPELFDLAMLLEVSVDDLYTKVDDK